MAVVFDQILPVADGVVPAKTPIKIALRSGGSRIDLSTMTSYIGHHPYEVNGDVLPETLSDFEVSRESMVGGPIGSSPTITVNAENPELVITKTQNAPQDGTYTLRRPVSHGPRILTYQLELVRPNAGAPSTSVRLLDGILGQEVGIDFIEVGGQKKIGFLGAAAGDAPDIVYDWTADTRYTYIIDPQGREVVVMRDGVNLLWRISYDDLNVPVSDAGYISLIFGNDGPNLTALTIKKMQLYDAPKPAVLDGLTSSSFGTYRDVNSPLRVRRAKIEDQAHAWAGSTVPDAIPANHAALTGKLTRTDGRVDGNDWVLLIRCKVAEIVDVPQDDFVGVEVSLSRANKMVQLRWLHAAKREIGLLKVPPAEPARITGHTLLDGGLDWRSERVFKILASNALAGPYVYVDTEDTLDLSPAWATLPVGQATEVAFGVADGYGTEVTLLDFMWLPAVVWHVDMGLPNANGWALVGDAGNANIAGGVLTTSDVGHSYNINIATFDASVGSLIEARATLDISSFMALDDGNEQLALRAYDTNQGKCVYVDRNTADDRLSMQDALDAREPAALARAHFIDWSEAHTYRLEWSPDHGVRLYMDNEVSPVIEIVAYDSMLPDFALNDTASFGGKGVWHHVYHGAGDGYDFTFHRIYSDVDLARAHDKGGLIYVQADEL